MTDAFFYLGRGRVKNCNTTFCRANAFDDLFSQNCIVVQVYTQTLDRFLGGNDRRVKTPVVYNTLRPCLCELYHERRTQDDGIDTNFLHNSFSLLRP